MLSNMIVWLFNKNDRRNLNPVIKYDIIKQFIKQRKYIRIMSMLDR